VLRRLAPVQERHHRKLATSRSRVLNQYARRWLHVRGSHRIDPGVARTPSTRRVQEKLKREAVEDFRIDFEDGYGIRATRRRTDTPRSPRRSAAKGLERTARSARHRDPYQVAQRRAWREERCARWTSSSPAVAGSLPPNFVVTLPKITAPRSRCRRWSAAFEGAWNRKLGFLQGIAEARVHGRNHPVPSSITTAPRCFRSCSRLRRAG